MHTIRVQFDGELLSEDSGDFPMPELEFSETLKFVANHYPVVSGITVDMFDSSGAVYASHTFN